MSNPFDDAVATLDPAQKADQQSQQQQAPAQQSSGNPFDDAAQQLQAATPTLETGQGLPAQGTEDNPFKVALQYTDVLKKARDVGQLGLRESALGNSVRDGSMTYEDAEKQIAADDHLAALSGDLENYEKSSAVPWLTGIGIETAKQLPMIEECLKPFAGGFAVGAAVPPAIGMVGGLPGVAAGATLSVPVGAFTGTAAVGGWTADVIKGSEYMKMRRKGMNHEDAKMASTISGLAQGMLSGLRFGFAAKMPVVAVQNVLKQHALSMGHMLLDGLKFTGEQEILAEAQTTAKLMTDAIAGTVAKAPNLVPTLQQATEEYTKTFNTTLSASIGMFVGGRAGGAVLGSLFKSILKATGKEHAAIQQEKLAKIAEKDAKENEADHAAEAKATPAPKEESKNAKQRRERAELRLEKRIASEREIRRIREAAASKYYSATDETRLTETERIQRLVKRMVTNSDQLDDKMKVKLLGRLTDLNGVADLVRDGESFIDDLFGNEKANAYKEAEGAIQGAISAGQQKGKKAKLPDAAQQSLKWYNEFFTAPKLEKQPKGSPKRAPGEGADEVRKAALQKATDYIEKGIEEDKNKQNAQVDKLAKDELAELFNEPAELAEKRRIAMQAQQFFSGNMDPADMKKLAGEIKSIVDDGKSAFLERKQAEAKRLLANRQAILDGVQGKKPVTPSTADSAPKQMTGAAKLVHSTTTTASALWDKLLQDTPADEREKLVGHLDFTDAENKEATINIAAAEKLTDLYTEAAGSTKEAIKLIRRGADPTKRVELKYTDSEGNTVTEKHTLNQLTYLHMAMDDQGALPGMLQGNKYTLEGWTEAGHTSTQEAVRDILQQVEGGKYIKLGAAVKDFYRWFAPQVGNHYLKEFGTTLPMTEDYSGQIFHRQLERIKSAGDLLQDVHQFAQRSLDPGSTKARSNSTLPLRLVDPFQQVQRHHTEMAFWIANSEKARELSFIFSDSSKDGLKDVIAHKLGGEMNQLIDGRLAFQFHLKPGILDIGDKSFQTIKGNMATGMLGARIDQAPKQWTSVLQALSRSNYAEFADGLRGAMDKEKLQGYLSRSELYKDRMNHILPQILEATQEQNFVDSVTGDKALALKTFFLTPMHTWGDGVGSAVEGFIEYNRALKGGATPEEAALAGDRLIDQTSSSSRPSQKVPAEMKGGVANLALSFQKESIQAVNRESGSIRDYFIHKDPQHLARMVRTVAAIHVGQTIFQTINSLPGLLFGDKDEQKQSVLRIAAAGIAGSYGQLPLIGWDVVGTAISQMMDEHPQEPQTILGGLVSNSFKLVTNTGRMVKDAIDGDEIDGEDWVREFRGIASTASVVTGIPFWGMWKYTELGTKLIIR